MKLTVIETIWVAENHRTDKLLAATRHYDDMIELFCEKGWITENSPSLANVEHSMRDDFGDKWKDVLKSVSAKKINQFFNFYDFDVSIRQIDLIKMEEDT